MNDRSTKHVPTLLLILVLAAPGSPASADEPAADAKKTAETSDSGKNLLRWKTATEVDNFGYNIYRGDTEDGPFERLNSDPIPGAGSTDEPTTYEYLDDAIDPYATYWYYLESISMSGVKERFTPIFPMEPKLERESDEDTGDPEDG